jgi:photosystem II stability/assembly factor-like uncharacterized protein
MKKLIFFIVTLLLTQSSKAQFEILNTNTTAGIGQILIKDSYILLAGHNYAVKTYDTGKTFIDMILPTQPNYFNIFNKVGNKLFLTSTSASISNENIQFFVSDDDGDTWTLRYDTTSSNFHLTASVMSDSLHGVMTSLSSNFNGGQNTLRTEDGGYTWMKDSMTIYTNIGTSVDDSCILLGGSFYGGVRFSTDYGINWESGGIGSNASVYAVYAANIDTVYALGNGFSTTYLLHSFNGMNTFITNQAISLQTPFDAFGLAVLSKNEIYSCGRTNGFANTGTIMKTINLGVSWEVYNTGISVGMDGMLGTIVFINDSIALISGSDGLLLKWNKYNLITSVIHSNKPLVQLLLSPNPASDAVTINYITNDASKVDIIITDVFGRTLLTRKLEARQGSNPFIINISSLASGIYLASIVDNGKLATVKFVKQ